MLLNKEVRLEVKSIMRRIKIQVKCENCGSNDYQLIKQSSKKGG
jgi:hypothetical protein